MFVQMMTPMMLDMLDGRKTHTLSLSLFSRRMASSLVDSKDDYLWLIRERERKRGEWSVR